MEPQLTIINATISYNPEHLGKGKAGISIRTDTEVSEAELVGILNLIGWKPEQGQIKFCHFKADPAVPVGKLVITPGTDLAAPIPPHPRPAN